MVARIFVGVAFLVIGQTFASADEPVRQFLDGLRERKYFDTALEHIESLKQRTNLPQETSQLLDLERGLTYQAQARASRIPEDRELALSKAEAAFKAFLTANPDHPESAFVNSSLGTLLFDRARAVMWDADAASNADRRPELQQTARGLITEAKKIFETSKDQYEAKVKQFPSFIDQDEQPDLFQDRFMEDIRYLRQWFNSVRGTYELGLTYDEGSEQRKEQLQKAADEFDAIVQARRNSPIGIHSKLMKGRCFQLQGDLTRALGIFNELVDGNAKLTETKRLRSLAIQFRLICLNDEKKQDHQLVLQEADRWLADKDYRQFQNREEGLGIRWEKCIALEKLAQDRNLETSAKNQLLRTALTEAQKISLFSSPYRAASTAMAQRLQASLGDADAAPQDFATAFERAKGLVSQLSEMNDRIAAADTNAAKREARQAKQRQLDEIGRLLQLAMELRDEDTPADATAQARYLLSYVFMTQRKSYDALILARYCMTKDRMAAPETAMDATEIAIQAAVQAFNDATDDQSFELAMLKGVCETIISEYPNSARGNEARFRLGKVYRDLNQPIEAATTYLTIPADSPEFASSRMQAGQSLWLAWAQEMAIQSGEEDLSDDAGSKLNTWKSDAEKHLTAGLQAARASLGNNATPTPEMVAAEVSLATINNMNGKFDETIQRLTSGGENSVLRAIEPAEGQTRPAEGIQSGLFAAQAWRLMLRAYVGTEKIDQALQAMEKLESIGAQDTTAIYTDLGVELQEELERLQADGESARLTQVRQSFEQFLGKVYDQRDSTDFNSLLWIGETYFGLGQGVSGNDQAAANEYYSKATSAFSEILDNQLAPSGTEDAVKLRLLRCQRSLRQYQQALDLAVSVLDAKPMQLDMQFEASKTLAEWGADPAAGQPAKLGDAINGIRNADDRQVVWGYQSIANRLRAREENAEEWAELQPRFFDASYENIRSRYLWATSGGPNAKELLGGAKAQVEIFAIAYFEPAPQPNGKRPADEAQYRRFSRLYEDIQVALGEAPQPLERPEAVVLPPTPVEPTDIASQNSEQSTQTVKPGDANQQSAPPDPPNYLLITLMAALGAGGGFALYKLMGTPRRSQRKTYSPSKAPSLPTGSDSFPSGFADGGSDVPDFSALSGVKQPAAGTTVAIPGRKAAAAPKVAAKPRTVKPADTEKADGQVRRKAARPAAAPTPGSGREKAAGEAAAKASASAPAGQSGPAKKKVRKKLSELTPEELARYKAAKAAREKKAAAAGEAAAGKTVRKKAPNPGASAVRKKPPGDDPATAS